MSLAHKQVTHTLEWNAAVSRGVKKHRASGCANPCCHPTRSATSLEYALQMLLESAEFDYEAQVRFGSKRVDFYVASHNLAFEADGKYWHQDKDKQRWRDKCLTVVAGISAIIHLADDDLDPWLEAK